MSKSIRSLVVLALLPLLVLWRAVFLGETIGPWEHVAQFGKASPAVASQPFDVLQMDAALQFYPWRDLVFESWRQGSAAMWNPYVLMGNPLAGNSQSGVFYPPHVLIGLAQVPTSLAITLLAWFHLALAGIGVFLLCKRLGGHPVMATIAGGSFSLSAFMVAWTPLASVPSTVAWLPFVALGLWMIWDPDKPEVLSGLCITTLAIGLTILAGHLQFAAYGALLFLVLTFGFVLAFRNAKSLGYSLLAAGGGLILALPHLSAVSMMLPWSHRVSVASEAGWNAYAASGLRWWEWLSLPAGDLLGSPARYASQEYAPLSQFWPSLVKQGANYAESAVAVGVIVLFLAAISVRSGHRLAWIFGSVVLVGVLLASASPLARLMYFTVPGWSGSGSPGRAAVLVVLALCVLAGMVKPERIEPGTKPIRHPMGQVALGVFALLAVCMLALRLGAPALSGFSPDVDAETLARYISSNIAPFSGPTLAIVALLLACIGLIRKFEAWPTWVSAAAVVALLPGILVAPIRTGQVPNILRGADSQRIATVGVRWNLLAVSPTQPPPNLNILSRTPDVAGYDSLIPRTTVDQLKQAFGRDPAAPANGNMMLIPDDAPPQTLASLGAAARVGPAEGETLSLGGAIATLDGEPISAVQLNTSGVRLNVPKAGRLLLKIGPSIAPWTGTYNGNPVAFTVQNGFLETSIPGPGKVELKWEEPRGAMILSWLVLVGCIGAIVSASRRGLQPVSGDA